MNSFDAGSALAGNPAQAVPAAGHANAGSAGNTGAAQAPAFGHAATGHAAHAAHPAGHTAPGHAGHTAGHASHPAGHASHASHTASHASHPAGGVFSSLDADMRAFAENKGWHKDQNPIGAVLKSYRELESRLGGALPLPAEGDARGWRKLYSRLGMPDSPEAYALNLPEEHNPDVAGKVRELFHFAGLTQAQAAAVYDGYMDLSAPYLNAMAEAKRADEDDAKAAAGELGPAGITAARNACRRFLTDIHDVSAVEKIMGSGRMLRFFAGLAKATGEDGKGALGIGSGGNPGSGGSGPGGKYTVADVIREAFANAKKQRH